MFPLVFHYFPLVSDLFPLVPTWNLYVSTCFRSCVDWMAQKTGYTAQAQPSDSFIGHRNSRTRSRGLQQRQLTGGDYIWEPSDPSNLQHLASGAPVGTAWSPSSCFLWATGPLSQSKEKFIKQEINKEKIVTKGKVINSFNWLISWNYSVKHSI